MSLLPADYKTHQVDEKTNYDNAEGNLAHDLLFCRNKKQVAQKAIR